MDFFGIGPLEILLIMILALILVGPGKITETARMLGRTISKIKKAGSEITAAATAELEADKNRASAIKPKELKEEKPSTHSNTTIPRQDDNPAKPGETSS